MSIGWLFLEPASCKLHKTKHESNDSAIITRLFIDVPEIAPTPKQMYKNTK